MYHKLFSRWLKSIFAKRLVRGQGRRTNYICLRIEQLEDRVVPIVGQTAIPAAIAPGTTNLGGVVMVSDANMGSGSLINSGSAPGELMATIY